MSDKLLSDDDFNLALQPLVAIVAAVVRPSVLFSFYRCLSRFWVHSFSGLVIVFVCPFFRSFGLIPCRQSCLSGILTAKPVAQLCTDFDSIARGNRGSFVLFRRAPLLCLSLQLIAGVPPTIGTALRSYGWLRGVIS